jgi:hypothetical protein
MKHGLYLLFSLFFISMQLYGAHRDPDPRSEKFAEQYLYGLLGATKPENTEKFSYRKELHGKGSYGLRLQTKNFEPGTRYSCYTVNAMGGRTCMGLFIADSNGSLIAQDPPYGPLKPGDPLEKFRLDGIGMSPSEPLSFALYPENGEEPLIITYTDFPIEYKWKDGAQISLHLMDLDKFFIAASGLPPHEKIIWTAETCGRIFFHDDEGEANDKGQFASILMTGLQNKRSGIGKVTVYRKSSYEVASMTFYWGEESKKRRTNI